MTAIEKLNAKLANLSDDALMAVITAMNKPVSQRTAEETLVRGRGLGEYEKRHGEEAVDLLMDALDEAIAA